MKKIVFVLVFVFTVFCFSSLARAQSGCWEVGADLNKIRTSVYLNVPIIDLILAPVSDPNCQGFNFSFALSNKLYRVEAELYAPPIFCDDFSVYIVFPFCGWQRFDGQWYAEVLAGGIKYRFSNNLVVNLSVHGWSKWSQEDDEKGYVKDSIGYVSFKIGYAF